MCGTHATVRSLMGELVAAGEDITVADMEAGLEHLSRGTPRYVDTFLVMLEPYYKSLETGRKAYDLASELGIPRVYALGNKARTERDEQAIREFCARHGLNLLSTIPFDEALVEAEMTGMAPLDYDPNGRGVLEISGLAEALEAPG